jgi:prepilin-type processing-associated H-X9-DG protein
MTTPIQANDAMFASLINGRSWMDLVGTYLAKPTDPAYMITLEDLSSSGEGDMLDICILVDIREDGVYGTWAWTKGHGYTQYRLYDPQGQIVNDVSGQPCNLFHQPQQWQFANRCSYGINNRAQMFLNSDSNHILMVEYCKLVANVLPIPPPNYLPPGDWTTYPNWTASDQWGGWGASRFRHAGTMNVLYFDGHVDPHVTGDINPMVNSIANDAWRPARDPAF